MKKGLRHAGYIDTPLESTLKPCPDEEGIKTNYVHFSFLSLISLKPCPDEEGIKTSFSSQASPKEEPLKPCPDEEGIKTRDWV